MSSRIPVSHGMRDLILQGGRTARGARQSTGYGAQGTGHRSCKCWGILQELVMIIAEAFQIDDERVMDTLINRSETFKHFINLDNLELKQAA